MIERQALLYWFMEITYGKKETGHVMKETRTSKCTSIV